MRVILDANVLFSYLLATSERQTVWRIVKSCFLEREAIQLVIPPELMDELIENVQVGGYLKTHVPLLEVERLMEQLSVVAEVPSPLAEDIPAYASDPDDDYLIVHGLAAHVDYLVTGDRRLRSLNQVGSLQVVTPLEFLSVLQKQGLIE